MSDNDGSGDSVEADVSAAGPDRVRASRPFIDDVFAVLADWRRREICQFFLETDVDAASVDELAMLVAGTRPPGVEGEVPTHDEVVVALDQTHLPQLDAAGVVDYDDRTGTVRYWGQPTVEKWLEHVTAVDHRSS